MVNADQYEKLKMGVDEWNQWRIENPKMAVGLGGAYLIGANLREANLNAADLHGANFKDADLRGAKLNDANLLAAEFIGANLMYALLHEANLSRANLIKADLSGADLSGAYLRNTNLHRTKLSGAELIGADFRNAHLHMTDLKDANLKDANLREANLREANLSGANLSGTNLSGASLINTVLQSTHLDELDLRDVRNLDQVFHSGPSAVSISTIYKSKGDIPHKFLIGAGVPANFLEYMAGLAGKAIEFYSCFISYTEADNAISEKLYYGLQAAEVRVWRWREKARTGEFIDVEINKAIRLHDKVVVICSGHSLKAEPVLTEIREALEKEAEFETAGTPRTVLFPIRIDDFVFKWKHELADEVRKRFIGDFRNWTDAEEYKESFDRLVADLNKAHDEPEQT